MGYPSGTYPSHYIIVCAAFIEIPKHLAIYLVVNLASLAIKSFTFSTNFDEVAVFGRST
jgi:hypothetical protein